MVFALSSRTAACVQSTIVTLTLNTSFIDTTKYFLVNCSSGTRNHRCLSINTSILVACCEQPKNPGSVLHCSSGRDPEATWNMHASCLELPGRIRYKPNSGAAMTTPQARGRAAAWALRRGEHIHAHAPAPLVAVLVQQLAHQLGARSAG